MNWRKHWHGMPEFICEDQRAFHTLRVVLTRQKPPVGKSEAFVTIHFTRDNFKVSEVARRLKRRDITQDTGRITLDTDEAGLGLLLFGRKHKIAHHSTWFPWRENVHHRRYEYRQDLSTPCKWRKSGVVNPEYPVFIISKGRWEHLLTARALERMGVPYTLVVEPKELEKYQKTFSGVYDTDQRYTHGRLHAAAENFSERGQGSIPVRNYVWDLALKTQLKRHWLMDDNIPTFCRTNRNLSIPVQTGAIFRAAEVFTDRQKDIAISGFYNSQFIVAKWKWDAFFLNTRVYSCTLIKNDLRLTSGLSDEELKYSKGRWRGRYNEDSDLCIRALKAGWQTVCFVTFNADKVGTMTMKGGNTDELYAGDGRLKMAQSLYEQHPDVVKVGTRWGRAQHIVDYKECVRIGQQSVPARAWVLSAEDTDNYGMVIIVFVIDGIDGIVMCVVFSAGA
jgi:hypothetical protein